MQNKIDCTNDTDINGNPAGGTVTGTGIVISWQNGPLGRGEDRIEPNGAFVEDVLRGVQQRIVHYQEAQDGKFECEENRKAIYAIGDALDALYSRTAKREARDVEGTHEA